MKAARLHEGATSLVVEEIDPPKLRPGTVIVDVEACFMSPFAGDMIAGEGHYVMPPRPFTPGMDAVGKVAAVANDVDGIVPGQRVYCDPLYQSEGRAGDDDFGFIGGFAMGPKGERMLARWPDGGFAEQMLLPAACAVPIPDSIALPSHVLCRLGWIGTAYGGFLHGKLEAGQHVAVNGASGVLGASAVLVALAMGAGRVYALGRRQEILDRLAAADGRVVAGGALPKDARVDVVFSSVNAEDTSSIENLLPHVRRFGHVVITGATGTPLPVRLGWLLLNDIGIHGSLWFPRWAGPRLVDMIASGQLDLSQVTATTYPLDEIGRAIAEARQHYGGLNHVAITC
jgi:alcohol dehydrogenase